MQQTLFENILPRKFKVGDRVRLLLWENIRYFGTIEQIETTTEVKYLVKEDNEVVDWFEEKLLEKVDEIQFVKFGCCVLYPLTRHVITDCKDEYTEKDIPELEKTMTAWEIKGCTGYSYRLLRDSIKALKSL